MRQIHIADDVKLRFPGRDGEFDEGVEVGMMAALMSVGQAEIRRRIAPASLEQIGAVAEEFGYRLGLARDEGEWVDVVFLSPAARSRPRLVYSSADAAAG